MLNKLIYVVIIVGALGACAQRESNIYWGNIAQQTGEVLKK